MSGERTTGTTSPTPRPDVAPPEDWSFPVPEQLTLANGITALVFHVPGQYVVSVRYVLPLSLVSEPRDREGIATIMARLLDEGSLNHTAEEFAELMERKGIAFGSGVTEGTLGVDLDVSARFLGDALDLLRQTLAEPVFDAEETSRHVQTRLAEIEQERASAPHRAAREFIATFYDREERASRPTAGTAATVAEITRDELVDFHRRHVGPQGSTVVVAGDLTGLDVPSMLEQTLGLWRGAPDHLPPPVARAPRRAADAARIVLVDRPGSVQTELSIGCPGPHRRIEGGWAPFPVLGFMMGGSPNARIDAVLREEKGYTYGIRSGFRPRPADGMFLTSGSVRADSTADALGLLIGLLRSGRDGFSASEVSSGVDFIAKTAPGRYATADAVADEAASLAIDSLAMDFTTTNLRQMRSLTGDDLTAAYREHVDGTNWTIVLVADAASLVDEVRGLGLGEVTVIPS